MNVMNMSGVRRFLGGAGTTSEVTLSNPPTTVAPLSIGRTPAQRSGTQDSNHSEDSTLANGISLRQESQPFVLPNDGESGSASSPSVTSTSPSVSRSQSSATTASSRRRVPLDSPFSSPIAGPSRMPRRSDSQPEANYKRSSGPLSTREELLMSLLASEAVVDSREYDILSSEEVETLKKEHQALSTKVEALTRKFNLEKKMRDALARVNGSQPTVSKQSEEQLEASNRKVDAAQRELWRVSERSNEVHRKLLEHRAGVLSINVRNLERKMNKGNGAMNGDDSGYNTPNQSGTLSPIASSVTSTLSSSKPRFDHFFAGHVDSVVPKARRPISPADLIALEDKLKTATDALASAEEERAKVTQELSRIRLEKEQIETMMGMELQSAEDKVVAMEEDISALRESDVQLRELLEERTTWERDRVALMDRSRQVEDLERRVKALDQQGGQAQILELKMQLDVARRETASLRSELEEGRVALRNLVQSHGMSPIVKNISLPELIAPLGSHLASTMAKAEAHTLLKQEWETNRRKLEEDIRAGQDKREALYREVEEARNEREEARRELRAAEARSKELGYGNAPPSPILLSPLSPGLSPGLSPDVHGGGESAKIVSILQPIWSVLPSPESRAAKFTARSNLRTNSPTTGAGSPKPVASVAELDVRSLKQLYESNRLAYPASPNLAPFSIEAFAHRVQALIADDKALIERLIRFALAHDMLKQNADRAHKLAQESGGALETYQKQVQTLQERNATLSSEQIALQDEIHQLQEAVDRLTLEKQEIEAQVAKQAETCRQLTQTNSSLSARAHTLAQEAAAAPTLARKQLDQCQIDLQKAQEQIEAMRMSENDQRIALLDELNAAQTENENLRTQLRVLKK